MEIFWFGFVVWFVVFTLLFVVRPFVALFFSGGIDGSDEQHNRAAIWGWWPFPVAQCEWVNHYGWFGVKKKPDRGSLYR